ncbi:MAG: response regulator [Chitinophagaceae bacterium]|nr:MAG: response regulator [Chitinophagaceae bacterium]
MRRNILSINGNKPMNFLLQTVLSPRYNLLTVSDVYQGMNELKTRDEVEMVIVDIDFHTQENLDFIQHIKTSGLYQDTPVIVLTSNDNRQKDKIDSSKVTNFFYKPFSPLDMLRSIDDLLYEKSSKLI